MPLIIAIDGPAAAGKGTLARRLAAHFGLPYLDTGLLYRAVARRVIDAGHSPADAAAAAEAARTLQPQDTQRGDLRGPPVDEAASLVASVPACASSWKAANTAGRSTSGTSSLTPPLETSQRSSTPPTTRFSICSDVEEAARCVSGHAA